ncbi:uncharacterized protein N7473_011210 [Penicillium subrubescens]|uniref:uncharacterized protein n=1 Tax=Penicillium subrubescens TaxID=1316194 RepID=UPI002544DC84|nr:uncharacterized protein N7473_011210 [Penicillium subrubescens]KAJ5882776.1 hypothetical protein N7473_011210 [Penicillium subrubescens]
MPDQVMKILMLHGHDQSEQIFKPKARYIEAAFHSFAQENEVVFEFKYLSGILPARPDQPDGHEKWVWGYGDPSDGEITNIELSTQHILATLHQKGPFVGIVGFSSGAAMAAIIASHLEKRSMFNDQPWVTEHSALRFAICLSGFRLGPIYDKFYEPTIRTPILLAIGSYDPVITAEDSHSLAKHCQFARIFEFSGVHYVPQFKESRDFRKTLNDFLEEFLFDPPAQQAPRLSTQAGAIVRSPFNTRPFLRTYRRRREIAVASGFTKRWAISALGNQVAANSITSASV